MTEVRFARTVSPEQVPGGTRTNFSFLFLSSHTHCAFDKGMARMVVVVAVYRDHTIVNVALFLVDVCNMCKHVSV